jgi:hypothetical protein
MKWLERILLWTVSCIFCILVGCTGEVRQEYGYSDTALAEQSPGGLSVFREIVKARKLSTQTMVSLQPSMENRVSTIVWTPDYFPQHTKSVLDRLDSWLRQGGKTLVYIGRDYSPHADYWERVADDLSNGLSVQERARMKIQAANSANQLDDKRDTHRELLITPWFYWRKTPGAFRNVTNFQGDWSGDPSLTKCSIPLRSSLHPFDVNQLGLLTKELDWNTIATAPAGGGLPLPPTPPAPTPAPPRKSQFTLPNLFKPSGVRYANIWNTDDEELLRIAKGVLPGDRGETKTLLASADGLPLISSVAYRNSSSRVIVLSSSAAISNINLLNPANRYLANKIVDQFSSGTVGFVSMDTEPPIKEGTSQEENKGFEMLTVWPFNVITIHAALVAMVALIAAFPIFGRPKTVPKPSQVDFGEHVESIGELLRATGGRQLAKDAISRYFRIVRRDTKSPWVQRESTSTDTSTHAPSAYTSDKPEGSI